MEPEGAGNLFPNTKLNPPEMLRPFKFFYWRDMSLKIKKWKQNEG